MYYVDYEVKANDYENKDRFNELDEVKAYKEAKKNTKPKYYKMSKEEFVKRAVKDLAIRKEMREKKVKEEAKKKAKEEVYLKAQEKKKLNSKVKKTKINNSLKKVELKIKEVTRKDSNFQLAFDF